jgi:rare lipoprotein A
MSMRRTTGALLLWLLLPPLPLLHASEEGLASWYGGKFQGRLTASGEVFDTFKLTAAHRTLPFGTFVKVTNLENGRSAVVRVNDRGPYVEGRIIDLSMAAAAAIGMTGRGVARVSVEIMPAEEVAALALDPSQASLLLPDSSGPHGAPARYAVQVGAFRTEGYALDLQRRLRERGFAAEVELSPEAIYRVLLDDVPAEELEELKSQLREAGWPELLVRPLL